MSDLKMTCPACGARTNDIGRAFIDGCGIWFGEIPDVTGTQLRKQAPRGWATNVSTGDKIGGRGTFTRDYCPGCAVEMGLK